jgi:hypothetical protein
VLNRYEKHVDDESLTDEERKYLLQHLLIMFLFVLDGTSYDAPLNRQVNMFRKWIERAQPYGIDFFFEPMATWFATVEGEDTLGQSVYPAVPLKYAVYTVYDAAKIAGTPFTNVILEIVATATTPGTKGAVKGYEPKESEGEATSAPYSVAEIKSALRFTNGDVVGAVEMLQKSKFRSAVSLSGV